ncbi:MAG: hypothetical protein K5921_04720, partial [Lachnospiraceae bacterium]|nr:hypothetical protein [Lachnospiraceae bacterium]
MSGPYLIILSSRIHNGLSIKIFIAVSFPYFPVIYLTHFESVGVLFLSSCASVATKATIPAFIMLLHLLFICQPTSPIREVGWQIKNKCKSMMKAGLVAFIATDAHEDKKRTPTLSKCVKYI